MPPRSLDDDDDLMRRVQRDEPGAFEALYAHHRARALRAARLVNPTRAEDAVQEGFISVWRDRRRYRPGGSVGGWIAQIVRRRALDLTRAEARAAPATYDSSATPTAQPGSMEDDYIASRDAELLRAALLALPGRQREAIVLAYFGGLSHSQIAGRLSLPDGTVKGRIRLGLQKLRGTT